MKNNRPDRKPYLAMAIAIALGLSSCGGKMDAKGKPSAIPDVLRLQKPKAPKAELAAKPTDNPGDNPGVSSKEYYPPTGRTYGTTEPPAGGDAKTIGEHRAKAGKYTLNFDEADLAEVAKVILSDTLKANYVINPKVTGKVSLQTARALTDEELIPTLEMLLRANGAVLIKEKSLFRIEPDASAAANSPAAKLGLGGQNLPSGYQLRIVPLRYVSVQEMQKVIDPLMPPKSVIRADETRNLLLLAGTSDELESVLETIRIMDVDFMRGMAVGVYPLKNVDASTIAEEIDKLLTGGGKGPLGGMFRIMPIERLNAVMAVTPQPRYLEEVESWIERLDRYDTNRTGNMHVYRVQNVDAAELANTLAQIFGQGGRSRGSSGSVAPGMTGGSVSGGFGGGFGGSSSGGGFSDSSDDGLSSSSSGFGGIGGSSSGGLGGSSSGLSGSSSGTGLSGGLGSSSSTTGRSGAGGVGNSSSVPFGASGGGGGGFGGSASGGSRRSRGGGQAIDLGNNMRIVADPANNALVIMAKGQDYKEIENVIKQLDVMPLQVLIDATIVEVTLSGNLTYGLQWLFTHANDAHPDAFQNGAASLGGDGKESVLLEGIKTTALSAAGPGGFAYAFAGRDIRLVINALALDNKVNVVSSPSLMVLNNQQAAINVGTEVPVALGGGAVTSNGTIQGGGINYKKTGVTLNVKPRVNAGGLVIMDILQTIVTPGANSNVGNTQTPSFSNREIQSQVAVNSGETLALGGLISDSSTNGNSGLPWLSQIPGLGWLFGSTSKSNQRTELVVLLTPRVVEKRQDITEITNEFRKKLSGIYDRKTQEEDEKIINLK